ncbi:hypothetical protein [Nocardia sp. alder85J]|uniref:hypothetical protein n=1 Tax=Nocardia sp. alder85J TaxID=2862949 RepID=UPI001CD415B5|nr:hypothetical protein [Nocardia sp. alder85J]MCX4094837.1 hypothetical protein [Nocardia sp. alder85J]
MSKYFGPLQFAVALGLPVWAFDRARADGLIPVPDAGIPSRPVRWSETAVAEAIARAEEIRAAVGAVPDVGAVRAAEVLSQRLGCVVDAETVEELARMQVIPEVGEYKGYRLYCGRTLERFTDLATLGRAEARGQLLTAAGAADYLRVRVSDLSHVVGAKWLEPVKYGRSRWRVQVALFRVADLDVLLTHPGIDWEAVRATPAGRPSPLAALTRGRAGEAR